MNRIELLAPAGSFDALAAAVESGADAVYLGGSRFNARAYADNFDDEKLRQAVRYAHIRGAKVYVTVNILISDEEMKAAIDYVRFLYNIDVDAIILQDIGLIKAVNQLLPEFEIHGSTQMTIHNVDGVKQCQKLGLSRVVLARELSLQETKSIIHHTDMEIESFVHGALCICYSGQCYMSSVIGGRSGNRGRCAQPCRRKYAFYDLEKNKTMEELEGKHLLSTRDLNTYERIQDIVSSGITSLKIEGRMKKPEYVAIVVKNYRDAIDMYYKNSRKFSKSDAGYELTSAFNRQFTEGYLFNKSNDEIVSIDRPDNRGVYIGKVVDKKGIFASLRIEALGLNDGDGIEIIAPSGKSTGATISGIRIRGTKVDKACEGQICDIYYKGHLEPGSRVYKTYDFVLNQKALKEYAYENKVRIPLTAEVSLHKGESPNVTLRDDIGNTASYTADYIIEAAKNAAVAKEKVIEQLKKTGDTPYDLTGITLKMDEDLFLPLKIINEMRREAIVKLGEIRANRNRRAFIEELNNKKALFSTDMQQVLFEKDEFVAGVRTKENAEAAIKAGIDGIYVLDCEDKIAAEILESCARHHKPCYYVMPNITKDEQLKSIEKFLSTTAFTGVVLSNISHLEMVQRLNIKNFRANYTINTFNTPTAGYLNQLGFERINPSIELSLKQIASIIEKAPASLEAMVYGYLPVMTTEYCPEALLKQCNLCKTEYNKRKLGLMDERGKVFPIVKTRGCRTQLLNSDVLFVLEELKKLKKSGIHFYRMDFYIEDSAHVFEVVELYKGFNGKNKQAFSSSIRDQRDRGFTYGHYFRGVE